MIGDTPLPRATKVVLVEDDEEVRRSMTLMLRSWGYSVEVYYNGMELLSLRHNPDMDCLLIDYKLPQMDGLVLYDHLKKRGVSAPAILITGFYSNSLASRAKALGFCDVVEKPGMNDTLRDMLRTHATAV